jgi:predicted dinucleotide-binding enzyme
VIDATNAFGPGGAIDLEPRTSSEEVLAAMPGARFVKAFNTMNFRPLGQRGHETPPLALFLAGDDAGAKETVAAQSARWASTRSTPARSARVAGVSSPGRRSSTCR